MNDVASNKTIIGVGSNAAITGGGLDIDGVSDVIIRNINFRNWGTTRSAAETSAGRRSTIRC